MMNDPNYFEAAGALAERALAEAGKTDASRLDRLFERALDRSPSPQEANVLLALLHHHRREFTADRPSAEQLLTVGEHPRLKETDPVELAAWTSVARTVLNLHETVTRE